MTSCSEFLDRKPLDSYDDSNFWYVESNVAQHSYYYYEYYYIGLGSGWTYSNSWLRSMYINDLCTYNDGQPGSFISEASSAGSYWDGANSGAGYSQKSWGDTYIWVRRANVFIKRLEEVSKDAWGADSDAYKHWSGIARYFRAIRYVDLVWGVGDVPYFSKSTDNMDELCKPRDNRYAVLDSAIVDLKYAIENCREDAGGYQFLNRYAIAAHTARYFTWLGCFNHYVTETYGGGNAAKAKEYLNFAIWCCEQIMDSGKYSINTGYRETFGNSTLEGNAEVIFGRDYAVGQTTHAATSYQNYNEGQSIGPSGHFIRSVLFWDGKLANETQVIPDAQNPDNYSKLYSMVNNQLVSTHDPRLECIIKVSRKLTSGAMSAAYSTKGGTRYYVRKNFPRGAEHYTNSQAASETMTKSASNFVSYPEFRYGEVLINWIIAKAELAEWGGGAAITQADIDKSINVLRARPIGSGDKTAGLTIDPQNNAPAEIGVTHQLAPMDLNNLPNDLARDTDVSPLLWELRREHSIELFLERVRAAALRSWGKWLDYTQRYNTFPGKYSDGAGGLYPANAFDNRSGDLFTTIADGTINAPQKFYPNTKEGNLLQTGAYFDLPELYAAKVAADKAVTDAQAAGADNATINLLKAEATEANTALTAFTGQGTGRGLWCVDQNGVQHQWMQADGYTGPKFEAMKGWYIVGKNSLLLVTRSEMPRNYLAPVPLSQFTFYTNNGYDGNLVQNEGWIDHQ